MHAVTDESTTSSKLGTESQGFGSQVTVSHSPRVQVGAVEGVYPVSHSKAWHCALELVPTQLDVVLSICSTTGSVSQGRSLQVAEEYEPSLQTTGAEATYPAAHVNEHVRLDRVGAQSVALSSRKSIAGCVAQFWRQGSYPDQTPFEQAAVAPRVEYPSTHMTSHEDPEAVPSQSVPPSAMLDPVGSSAQSKSHVEPSNQLPAKHAIEPGLAV